LSTQFNNLPNFNELASIINVIGVSITYIAIVYSFNGYPSGTTSSPTNFGPVNFGIVDMSYNVISETSLNLLSSTDINNPSILEYTFPSPITTQTNRCLRVALYNGEISNTDSINVRAINIGYN